MFEFFIFLIIILYITNIGVMMFLWDLVTDTDSFILQWVGSLFWPITVWIIGIITIIKYLRNERSNL